MSLLFTCRSLRKSEEASIWELSKTELNTTAKQLKFPSLRDEIWNSVLDLQTEALKLVQDDPYLLPTTCPNITVFHVNLNERMIALHDVLWSSMTNDSWVQNNAILEEAKNLTKGETSLRWLWINRNPNSLPIGKMFFWHQVTDLWNFVRNINMSSFSYSQTIKFHDALAKHVAKLALLIQTTHSEDEIYAKMKILDNLAKLVEERLDKLQNPDQCLPGKLVVCAERKAGLGSYLHELGKCLMIAMLTNRTAVQGYRTGFDYLSGGFAYKLKDPRNVFKPFSKCTMNNYTSDTLANSKNNLQSDNFSIDNAALKSIGLNTLVLSKLPSEFIPWLKYTDTDPLIWWVAQFTMYSFRMEKRFQQELDR